MPNLDVTVAAQILPALLEAIENGYPEDIIILRHGEPVARLVPFNAQRIGTAKGSFEVRDSTPTEDAEITKLFHAGVKPGAL